MEKRVKVKFLKDVGRKYKAGKEYVVLLKFAKALNSNKTVVKIPMKDIFDEDGKFLRREIDTTANKTYYEELVEKKPKPSVVVKPEKKDK